MTTRENAAKEYEAAIAKCREVLVAVAENRRQCGPIATHAQSALSQLVYAEELRAALPARTEECSGAENMEAMRIRNYRLYEALEHIEETNEKVKDWSETCARRRVYAENKWREVALENSRLHGELSTLRAMPLQDHAAPTEAMMDVALEEYEASRPHGDINCRRAFKMGWLAYARAMVAEEGTK